MMLFAGCAKQKTTRQEAFNFGALDTELQRGISTMDDVRRLFGETDGSGAFSVLPDAEPRTAWFYDKIEVKAEGEQIDANQDVLLIFFKGDRYDGYLWFSDAAKD